MLIIDYFIGANKKKDDVDDMSVNDLFLKGLQYHAHVLQLEYCTCLLFLPL